jgi:hypothetical protein
VNNKEFFLTLVVDICRTEVRYGNDAVAVVIGQIDLRGQCWRCSQRVENCFRDATGVVKFGTCQKKQHVNNLLFSLRTGDNKNISFFGFV